MNDISGYLINTRSWRSEDLDPDRVKMFYGNLKYQFLKILSEYEQEVSANKAMEFFLSKVLKESKVSRYIKTRVVRILKELVVVEMLDLTNSSHKLEYRRYKISEKGKLHIKEKEKRYKELVIYAEKFFDTSELVGDFKFALNKYSKEEEIRVRYGLKGVLKGFSIVLYFKEFTSQRNGHGLQFYTDLYTKELLKTSKFFGTLRSVNSKVPRTKWKLEEVEMFMIALRQYGKFPHPERYKSIKDINKEVLKSFCVFRHGSNQTIDLQDYEVPLLVSEFPLIRVLSKSVFEQSRNIKGEKDD